MFWGRKSKSSVHLVGIGGSGMSGIAEVLLASGFPVTGSDLHSSPTLQRLISLGAKVFLGHAASNIAEPSVVVVSSAVKGDNPEVLEARRRGIPVIARAEMLAELMRLKRGVAVAGSHGKTTTTSMLGQLLRSLDPTVVVGGRLQHWDASSIVGKGSVFVIEADESDRSFLKFSPVYSIVTNVDLEHLDNYRDIEDIENTFIDFLNRTAFFGMNWVSADCPHLRNMRARISKPTKTFGFSEDADLRITQFEFKDRRSIFELTLDSESLGSFEIPVVGKHNLMNASAAIALALHLGVGLSGIKKRLKSFVPADRRLQIHGESKHSGAGAWAVVEDYAHHPTEIRAALEAVQLLYPTRKKIVLFQPHRYSRTSALWKEFIDCFTGSVDELFLLPVYAAHEAPIPGVDSEKLLAQIPLARKKFLSALPTPEDLTAEFSGDASRVFVILGAAPLTKFAQGLASVLSSSASLRLTL